MNITEISIDSVRKPTDKQKAVGIHGIGTITIKTDIGIVCQMREMTLCQSKKGSWYIQPPYRKYVAKDPQTGQDTEQKFYYYILFPDKNNQQHLTSLVEKFRQAVSAAPAPGTSTQAPKPTPQPVPVNTMQNLF